MVNYAVGTEASGGVVKALRYDAPLRIRAFAVAYEISHALAATRMLAYR
jgi:hypothetical protein